jgi:hypothetical protein
MVAAVSKFVVGLGFGMSIGIIWDLGRKGIRITLVSLLGTLTIGWALGKLLKDKKMGRILLASCVLFLGLLELLPTLAVRAQDVQVEIVQPPMRFLTADTGREDRKIEPSGVAPIGDGSLLLVACDKKHVSV